MGTVTTTLYRSVRMHERAMSVEKYPVGHEDWVASEPLELLTDETEVWTVVPANATGDARMTQWISIEAAFVCDLEEWR